jgi:DNA invertase Pin-like site-specific DNA recombinase
MGTPYAYLRKSVIHRDQRTISPEMQEHEVRLLAARHGDNGTRLRILADWDVSGRRQSRKKRPGYLELVRAIETGECSAVYSYSLSRLSRSVSDLSDLFDLCRDHKVPIRLVADALDTSTASGMLTANILAGMAQFESDVASERVMAMYEQKRTNGEEIRTSRRFGEVRSRADGTVVGAGEDEALVLAAFDEAGSYSGAARRLNAAGVKPRMAEAWWGSSVAIIVQRNRPKIARRPPSRGMNAAGSAFAFARLLRCPTCERFLTGSSLREKNGGRRTRYACRNADAMPHGKVAITESIIAPWLQAEAARLRTPDRIETTAQALEERADLDRQRRAIGDALVDGLYSREQAREKAAEIDARIMAIETVGQFVDVPQIDWSWPPARLNDVLRALWSEVKLDANMHPVSATWNVPEWRA